MRAETAAKIKEAVGQELKRESYPEGFPDLPEIPGGRYISDKFYDLEMEHIWRKSWLCVLREEEVAAPGCYKLVKRCGLSIIVARGKDNVLRAFHNTCRHRGAPLIKEDGKRNLLMCGYHCWSYDLEGNLMTVPDDFDFANLDKKERSLIKVRCETWGGWIFINVDMDASPLSEELASVSDDLAVLQMETLRIKGRASYHIKCNWKAALDAFMEAYHVAAIHPKTVGTLLDGKGTSITLFKNGHQRMAIPKRYNTEGGTWGTDAAAYDIPAVPKVFRENNCAYGFFPNFVAPFDSAGFPIVQFWPEGKDQCRCDMIYVGAGDENENGENSEYWRTFIKNYDTIMEEDFQFLEGIQESLESGAFSGMKLSYQERRIYWLHEEFDRRIGWQNIPEALRVKQVLMPFAEG